MLIIFLILYLLGRV
ncbi:hypothetical protein LWH96_14025 [Legionella sp. 9fVS26]|uniref:Uncharacterized protein n=1 Tax=Legionella resiliens TaxID=2905958 RepID=A0ABS8X7I8_9GAMM|nr:hypothetical protein [Legionella sp. 9fVS26]MCE3533486.1 hypothetical protein [Legionella sp. 8cVS16]